MSFEISPMAPVMPGFQLPGAGGPPASLPMAPVPNTPLGAPTKKSFGETKFGQALNALGGLGGIFDAVGKARDAFGNRGGRSGSGGGASGAAGTEGPGFSSGGGDGGGAKEEASILGLPPLAFGGLAVVLITALVFVALRMGK